MRTSETEKIITAVVGKKEIQVQTTKFGLDNSVKAGTIYSPAMKAARKAGALGRK